MDSMSCLSITYPGNGFTLLFDNDFAAKMFAEQWISYHYNRLGTWDIIGCYDIACEYPQEYIKGVYVGVYEITIYTDKRHNVAANQFTPKHE